MHCNISVLVSGCNYVTLLTALLTILLYLLYTIFIKKELSTIALASFVLILPGFIISILAPGNSVRGENFDQMSAIAAVLISFPAAARSFVNIVFTLPFMTLLAAITPFVYTTINEHRINIKYKHPLIYCSLVFAYTPAHSLLHTMHERTGLGRIETSECYTTMAHYSKYILFHWLGKTIIDESWMILS